MRIRNIINKSQKTPQLLRKIGTYSHDPRLRKLLPQQVPRPENTVFRPCTLTGAAEPVHEDYVDERFCGVGGGRGGMEYLLWFLGLGG